MIAEVFAFSFVYLFYGWLVNGIVDEQIGVTSVIIGSGHHGQSFLGVKVFRNFKFKMLK